jgi:hypothetical protein
MHAVPAPQFHDSPPSDWFMATRAKGYCESIGGIEMPPTEKGLEKVKATWGAVHADPHAVRNPEPIKPGGVIYSNPLHPHRSPPLPLPATRAEGALLSDKEGQIRRIMFFCFGRVASAEFETIFCPDPWMPKGWIDPEPTSEYETQRLECLQNDETWYSVHGRQDEGTALG